MYLPFFFAVCIISMIFSIGPMEWLLSRRCVAKLDFLIFYLKSWRCSLYLFLNDLPVCPTYFISQSGHLRLYIPLFSKRCCGFKLSGLGISLLLKLLLTLYATLIGVSLNSLVMVLVPLPMYVNLAHNFLLSLLSLFCLGLLMYCTSDVSKPLLLAICSMIYKSFTPQGRCTKAKIRSSNET